MAASMTFLILCVMMTMTMVIMTAKMRSGNADVNMITVVTIRMHFILDVMAQYHFRLAMAKTFGAGKGRQTLRQA